MREASKDENGFVKPDLSEMAKYFDNITYDYDFSTRDLNIVGKMKTQPERVVV